MQGIRNSKHFSQPQKTLIMDSGEKMLFPGKECKMTTRIHLKDKKEHTAKARALPKEKLLSTTHTLGLHDPVTHIEPAFK